MREGGNVECGHVECHRRFDIPAFATVAFDMSAFATVAFDISAFATVAFDIPAFATVAFDIPAFPAFPHSQCTVYGPRSSNFPIATSNASPLGVVIW